MASKPLRASKPTEISMNGTVAAVNSSVVHPAHHHIWLVTGPAGCGKSTVAMHVAEALNMPYLEGDEVSLSAPFRPHIQDSIFVCMLVADTPGK